jgi:hypothetical protein
MRNMFVLIYSHLPVYFTEKYLQRLGRGKSGSLMDLAESELKTQEKPHHEQALLL